MGAMDYGSVAQWYDFYATVDVDIPFYRQEIDAGGDRVLELACGTGRVSVPLLEAGINLTCVDMSVEMLDVLRRKLAAADLHAEIACQDVRELDLGQQFDVVIMPFTSFMELADRADQLKALRAIRRHLSPRGRFLCALHNPARRLAAVDGLLHLAGRAQMDGGETMLLWSLENHDAASHTVSGLQTWRSSTRPGVWSPSTCWTSASRSRGGRISSRSLRKPVVSRLPRYTGTSTIRPTMRRAAPS